jgi:hypothetical protein
MASNRDEGALLWFDDDTKRPLQQKILDGVERYRERMGYEPTQVQLNPAQAKVLEDAMQAPAKKRGKLSVPPLPELRLRLLPTETMRPHHFLIGIGPDDTHRKARRPSAERTAAERPQPALATRGRPRRRSDSARLAS